MKSSVFSNHPSIIPISFLFGIVTILILQFVWLSNSYNMMKDELMDKCRQNLREAIDDELYLRIEEREVKLRVCSDYSNPSAESTFDNTGTASSKDDINILLQDLLTKMGSPIKIEKIDSLFRTKISKHKLTNLNLKFEIINDTLPEENFSINKDSIKIDGKYVPMTNSNLNESQRKDSISNNIITARVTPTEIIRLEITSISNAIIAKGKFIFAISFLLCCLLGLILYNQYKKYKHNKQVLNFLVSYNSSIMHNILSPINSILMLADHIQDDHTETKKSSLSYYITFFVEQCSILEKNIRQVLTLARMGYTNIKLNPKPTPLKKFLSETFGFYEIYVATKKKRLDLSIRCEPEDLFVDMDQAYMKSVFANFIDNSIKYSSSHVVFNVECTQINDQVRIVITDNGFGIPENNLDDLFECFKRGDSKSIDTQASFGLGLSYIKDITEAHKGSVTLNYTSEEKGTQFTLLLPIRYESI